MIETKDSTSIIKKKACAELKKDLFFGVIRPKREIFKSIYEGKKRRVQMREKERRKV